MLVLLLALVIGGLFWFDYLGLIDAKSIFSPAMKLLRLPTRSGKAMPAESPTLLDDERFAKQLEAIDLRRQELDELERQAAERDAAIVAKAEEVAARQKSLDEQQKSFNSTVERYDNKKANIEQNARYLSGMPPKDAVNIIKSMTDDQMVIDILRAVEEIAAQSGEASVVAYWLSLLPPERSAAIQRKMSQKPSSAD
jgi:flagellar protein FlbB